MDFYRHRFINRDEFYNTLIDNLNSWGFCCVDNSPVIENPNAGAKGSIYPVKWKYDTFYNLNKNTYTNYRTFVNSTNTAFLQEGFLFYGLSNLLYIDTLALFFIPLKNKSFLLRVMTSPNTMTPEFKPFFEQFRINPNETPALYKPNPGTGDMIHLNHIGLFSNNNQSNPMNYLHIGYRLYAKYYKNGFDKPPIMYPNIGTDPSRFVNAIINSQNFAYPNFIDNAYILCHTTSVPNSGGSTGTLPPLETVDVNQNVCTLIRAPHDNSYIDGLYLIITSPMESVDGKVFSFGGRNFLGVCRNLVVELPAD